MWKTFFLNLPARQKNKFGLTTRQNKKCAQTPADTDLKQEMFRNNYLPHITIMKSQHFYTVPCRQGYIKVQGHHIHLPVTLIK